VVRPRRPRRPAGGPWPLGEGSPLLFFPYVREGGEPVSYRWWEGGGRRNACRLAVSLMVDRSITPRPPVASKSASKQPQHPRTSDAAATPRSHLAANQSIQQTTNFALNAIYLGPFPGRPERLLSAPPLFTSRRALAASPPRPRPPPPPAAPLLPSAEPSFGLTSSCLWWWSW
jgi:hypothetical protein